MCNSSSKTTSYLESAKENRNPKDVGLPEEQRRKPCNHETGGLMAQEEIIGKQNRTDGENIGIVQPVKEKQRREQAYIQSGMIKLRFGPL